MSKSVPEKQCTGPCGRTLAATPEFFCRKGTGLNSLCKECKHKQDKAYRDRPEIRRQIHARNKAYYDSHAEQERERLRDYRSRPGVSEQRRASAKAYDQRPEIRERKRTSRRNYIRPKRHKVYRYSRASNPTIREKYLVYLRGYNQRPERQERNRERQRQPEARKRDLIRTRNRRARIREVQGSHTLAQIHELLKRQKYRCYYCSAKFEQVKGKYVYHVDHTFPVSRVAGTDIPANDISYLVLACPSCNLKKYDKFPWEFHEGGKLL